MHAAVTLREVQVRFCDTANVRFDAIERYRDILSDDEVARCRRFERERDRRDFAVAHALLRFTLSSHWCIAPRDWRFEADADGKPQLSPSLGDDLSFNLSHTDGLVACAVTRVAPVGVDVEKVQGTFALDIAREFFSAAEIAALEQCPEALQQERFIEIWTLKESYIKAIGKGLALPLDRFAFAFDEPGRLRFTATSAIETGWSFALFKPTRTHRLAVAIGSIDPAHILVACATDHERSFACEDAIPCVARSVAFPTKEGTGC